MIVNPKAFFDAWREGFGPMSPSEVDGVNAIIAEAEALGWSDPRWLANVLAQVYHETGGQMEPVKETVYSYSTDRDPSDATVKARLEKAWAKGQLPWVKTPYWRTGWFGRGLIQLTHEDNYRKLGDRIGVDLVGDPDQALVLTTAAQIACIGMAEGLFTNAGLGDHFDANTDDPLNARRIVNGMDRAAVVAAHHEKALRAVRAGWGEAVAPDPRLVDVEALRARVAALEARLAAVEGWAADFSTATAKAMRRRAA